MGAGSPGRLVWISPRDMRKNRADAVKIMVEADAFARLGWAVEVVTPRVRRGREEPAKRDLWRLYNLEPSFRIVELPTRLTDGAGETRASRAAVRLQKTVAFGLHALWLALSTIGRREPVTIIAQCYAGSLPYFLARRLLPVPWRVYLLAAAFVRPRRLERLYARSADGVIAINEFIREAFVDAYGVPRERTHRPTPYSYLEVLGEAASISREDARAMLGLPADATIVAYTGKIGYPPHEEIEHLLEAAGLLPGYLFAFIGGNGVSEAQYRERAAARGLANVVFLGFRPLVDLHRLAVASDVLVSYYASSDALAATNRVPAKFSLYRCARRPMVVADFPGMREVLSEEEAYFVPPDRPELLAAALEEAVRDGATKGDAAYAAARENTISAYCAGITSFMRARPARRRPVAAAAE